MVLRCCEEDGRRVKVGAWDAKCRRLKLGGKETRPQESGKHQKAGGSFPRAFGAFGAVLEVATAYTE